MKRKAFVDTTVLTDVTLKGGSDKERDAREALKEFEITELPVYAIKELKYGPLQHYAYFHNLLVQQRSVPKAIEAIKILYLTPWHQRKASTALDAFNAAFLLIEHESSPELIAKYGHAATGESVKCDRFRLAVKMLIMKGWKRRRKRTTRVVLPLPCYKEADPFEQRGLIKLTPRSCDPNPECCLASALRDRPEDVSHMLNAIRSSDKVEDVERAKVLKSLTRKRRTLITDKMCRSLGDAVFAFFAPRDSVILTTNIDDHRPLAEALNKQAITPAEVLESLRQTTDGNDAKKSED